MRLVSSSTLLLEGQRLSNLLWCQQAAPCVTLLSPDDMLLQRQRHDGLAVICMQCCMLQKLNFLDIKVFCNIHSLLLHCMCAAAGACYLYGRSWSPTVHTLGRQLAALEDTEAAYAVASGAVLRRLS